MTLLNPLGLLFLLAAPPLIVIHLLSRYRRRARVPSLLLWRRLESTPRRSFLLRLRYNHNLILQLAAVVLAALAAAQPRIAGAELAGVKNAIVVIDTSASMLASSDDRRRLSRAKEEALRIVRELPDEASVHLMEASARIDLSEAYRAGDSRLLDRIQSVEGSESEGDMSAALRRALAASGMQEGSRIYVVSDGAFELEESLTAVIRDVRFSLIGEELENVGITAFAQREVPHGPQLTEILIEVLNAGARRRETAVVVDVGKASLERTVELAAGERRRMVFRHEGALPAVFSVRLSAEDALAADNRAYATSGSGEPLRVRFRGARSFFLESFFGVHPLARLVGSSATPPYDIVVLNGVQDAQLSSGAYLLINSTARGVSAVGPSEEAEIRMSPSWNREHPVTAGVDLSGMQVYRARPIEPIPSAEVLIRSGPTPLAFAFEAPELRVVSLSFDLFDTNLGLLPAFPVLLDNAVRWLAPGAAAGSSGVRTGTALPLPPGGDFPRTVVRPSGEESRVAPEADGYAETDSVGIHRVRTPSGGERPVAVNLLSGAETDLSPRFTPPPEQEVEREPTVASAAGGAWIAVALLLLAVAVLLVDLVVWRRGL